MNYGTKCNAKYVPVQLVWTIHLCDVNITHTVEDVGCTCGLTVRHRVNILCGHST